MTPYEPLLGKLAPRWFNEVTATDALRVLLDEGTLREAFLGFVGALASTDLTAVRSFERERVIADGRIDLEGVDVQGRPRLVIEAKFAHGMSVEQMLKYRSHQRGELNIGEAVPGVLLLLVPASRLEPARAIMKVLRDTDAASGPDAAPISAVAASWEDCLGALEATAADPRSGPVSLAADVAQLQALCASLASWIAPLTEVPEDETWEYLRVISEQVRQRAPPRAQGPIQKKDQDYAEFRYFGVPGAATWYSIGLTRSFADGRATPIWMRFHRVTNEFDAVSRALRRSRYAEELRAKRGHLWLPLEVDEARSGPELVDDLVAQVAEILRVLVPSPAAGEASHLALPLGVLE